MATTDLLDLYWKLLNKYKQTLSMYQIREQNWPLNCYVCCFVVVVVVVFLLFIFNWISDLKYRHLNVNNFLNENSVML